MSSLHANLPSRISPFLPTIDQRHPPLLSLLPFSSLVFGRFDDDGRLNQSQRTTLAAWQNASTYREKSRFWPLFLATRVRWPRPYARPKQPFHRWPPLLLRCGDSLLNYQVSQTAAANGAKANTLERSVNELWWWNSKECTLNQPRFEG